MSDRHPDGRPVAISDTLLEHPLRTVGDVAAILRLSPATVYRQIKRGHLVAFRLPSGHGIRVRDRDLLTFIQVGMAR